MRIITVYKPTNITGEAHPAGFMNGLIGAQMSWNRKRLTRFWAAKRPRCPKKWGNQWGDWLTSLCFLWLSGWWFGTMEFYDFPYIYTYMGMSSSQLTIIFFRGVETTFFLNPTALMNSPFDFQAPGGKSICSEWQKELAGSADRPPAIPPATDEEVDNKQVPVDQSTVFSVFFRVPHSALKSVLSVSGWFGIFLEPRPANKQGPHPAFAVVWLPESFELENIH